MSRRDGGKRESYFATANKTSQGTRILESLRPVGCICLERGKEAFTWLSNLDAILGMLEKGDIGAWLFEIQLQRYY